MSTLLQIEASVLLVLAAILSAVIGMNREANDRPAGLRTHMLVGIGSCLFSLVSVHAFPVGDPARIAAQVVSGMGFLGAGAIIKEKRGSVTGLTTAASLWTTAAIGMAVGLGAWFLGVVTTLLVWVVLVIIRRTEYASKERRMMLLAARKANKNNKNRMKDVTAHEINEIKPL